MGTRVSPAGLWAQGHQAPCHLLGPALSMQARGAEGSHRVCLPAFGFFPRGSSVQGAQHPGPPRCVHSQHPGKGEGLGGASNPNPGCSLGDLW